MALFFWDASALAKRYFGEAGSATVNSLFAAASPHSMATTPWGYTETYAMLLRRLNGGAITPLIFTTAVSALQAEVIDSGDFDLVSLDDTIVFASISSIRQHNPNATDAAILTLLLALAPGLPLSSRPCILLTADHRLARAASLEGLGVLNPEDVAPAELAGFFAGL